MACAHLPLATISREVRAESAGQVEETHRRDSQFGARHEHRQEHEWQEYANSDNARSGAVPEGSHRRRYYAAEMHESKSGEKQRGEKDLLEADR